MKSIFKEKYWVNGKEADNHIIIPHILEINK